MAVSTAKRMASSAAKVEAAAAKHVCKIGWHAAAACVAFDILAVLDKSARIYEARVDAHRAAAACLGR
jgi:hypothetical protein